MAVEFGVHCAMLEDAVKMKKTETARKPKVILTLRAGRHARSIHRLTTAAREAEHRLLAAARHWWVHLARGRAPSASGREIVAWKEESDRRKEAVICAMGLDAEARSDLASARRAS